MTIEDEELTAQAKRVVALADRHGWPPPATDELVYVELARASTVAVRTVEGGDVMIAEVVGWSTRQGLVDLLDKDGPCATFAAGEWRYVYVTEGGGQEPAVLPARDAQVTP